MKLLTKAEARRRVRAEIQARLRRGAVRVPAVRGPIAPCRDLDVNQIPLATLEPAVVRAAVVAGVRDGLGRLRRAPSERSRR